MNRRTLASIALTVLTLLPFSAVRAQMVDEAPHPVRVTRDQAEVRCGWGSETWYSVGRAPMGTQLTVDGREGDWLRVLSPPPLEEKWPTEAQLARMGKPFNDFTNHIGSIRAIRRILGCPIESTQD